MNFKYDLIEKLHGWCDENKASYLYNHVIENKPEIIMEIGVFGGKSLFPMAQALKENGKGVIVGVEPWASSPAKEGYPDDDPNNKWWDDITQPVWDDIMFSFYQFGENQKLLDYMEVHRNTSEGYLEEFRESKRSLDLLHVDGNHSTESAMFDVVNYSSFIRKGGYLVLDDMDWPSLNPVIKYVERDLGMTYMDSISRNESGMTCSGIYQK